MEPLGIARDLVAAGTRLSDDGLHPNARGNRVLAEYVADTLRMYGPGVRASP